MSESLPWSVYSEITGNFIVTCVIGYMEVECYYYWFVLVLKDKRGAVRGDKGKRWPFI